MKISIFTLLIALIAAMQTCFAQCNAGNIAQIADRVNVQVIAYDDTHEYLGSGFVVRDMYDRYFLVTACHAVEKTPYILYRFNGITYELGRGDFFCHSGQDVAFAPLEAIPQDVAVLPVGMSLFPRESVYAVGTPNGEDSVFVHEAVVDDMTFVLDQVIISGQVKHGQSGGALLKCANRPVLAGMVHANGFIDPSTGSIVRKSVAAPIQNIMTMIGDLSHEVAWNK